jgi:LuxR family transcriptional regulator, maltose regulon positive regulatory protein
MTYWSSAARSGEVMVAANRDVGWLVYTQFGYSASRPKAGRDFRPCHSDYWRCSLSAMAPDGSSRVDDDRLPIAPSKFGAPIVSASCVTRSRLADRLMIGDWRVAMVSAGPACGKAVAAAQWFQLLEAARQWVTLEGADDQPERFWLTVAVALERTVPGKFTDAVRLAAESGGAQQAFVDRLLIDLSAIEEPLALVLDDVHVLRSVVITEGLTSLVERLPPGVRLLLTSRTDPSLPLARWRARSWLVEIRERDLAFTLSETAELFAAVDEDRLDASDIEHLWRHTEGWVAGLRLAAATLADRADVAAAAREFSGQHRMVADLLVSEILDRQPPEVSEFLLRTSVVDVLDAEVCDALSGRHDSADVLRRLETDMPFLNAMNVDRSSYRYHPLLIDTLRAELAARHPGATPPLQQVAADVLEARGDAVAAAGHLLAAGQIDRAFSLAFVKVLERYDQCDLAAAAAWVELLPAELAAGSTSRMLTYAFALGLAGRMAEAFAWLERAAIRIADDPSPPLQDIGTFDALRLVAFTVSAASDEGTMPGERALEAMEAGGDLGHPGARTRPNLARAYLLVDRPDEAARSLTRGPVGDEVAQLLLVPAVSARVAYRQGHLARAEQDASRALTAADMLGMEKHTGAFDAYLARAGTQIDRNRLADARATLEHLEGIVRDRPEAVAYQVLARLEQIRLLGASPATDEAFAAFEELHHLMDGRQHPPLQRLIDAAAARWHIEAGELKWAEELIKGLADGVISRSLLSARLDLARQQPDKAAAGLAHTRLTNLRDQVTGELILARAAAESGKPSVEAHIERAVDLAVSEGLVRVFLEEGPVVARLARAAAERLATAGGTQLAAALGTPSRPRHSPEPAATFTEREQAILRFLPTRMTYQEIADECFISVNTVKSYLKGIYAKLGVATRSQAVERARLLGFL